MPQTYHYETLVAKYVSGEITPTERESLFAWVEADVANQAYLEDALAIWTGAAAVEEPSYEVASNSAWDRLDSLLEDGDTTSETSKTVATKVRRLPVYVRLLRIAAILLPLLLVGYWLTQSPDVPATDDLVAIQSGEQAESVTLPDGSKVWLNANSKLTYQRAFTTRDVTLTGEAFFDVTKDPERVFSIAAGGAVTKVLGTSFNVRAYPEEKRVELTVKTGKVAFAATKEVTKPVILTPGESGVYDESTTSISETKSIPNANAWQTKTLAFGKTNLREAVASIRRYFDVEIGVANPAILNCSFVVDLPYENPNLEEILETIVFMTNDNVQYEKIGANEYRLTGAGCQ